MQRQNEYRNIKNYFTDSYSNIVHTEQTPPVHIHLNRVFPNFFRLSSSTRALASLGTHLNTHVVKPQLNHATRFWHSKNCITTIPHYLEKYMKYIFSKKGKAVSGSQPWVPSMP
jgi:hypothetical protein